MKKGNKVMSDTVVDGKNVFFCSLYETGKELNPYLGILSKVTEDKKQIERAIVKTVEHTEEMQVPERAKEQTDAEYQIEVSKYHVLKKQGKESSYKGKTKTSTVIVSEQMPVIEKHTEIVSGEKDIYQIPFYSLPSVNFFSECCLNVIRRVKKSNQKQVTI